MKTEERKAEIRQISKALQRFMPKVNSLEMSLQGALTSKKISKTEFVRRSRYLTKLREEMDVIHAFVEEEKNCQGNVEEIGLPNLEGCSPSEIGICHRVLGERYETCRQLIKNLSELKKWVEESSEGHGDGLIAAFRLSKIKRVVKNFTSESKKLAQKERQVASMYQKLLDLVNSDANTKSLAGNFEFLDKVFIDIDRMYGDVTRLQDKVLEEQEKIRQMKVWMANHKSKLPKGRYRLSPPMDADILNATEYASGPAVNPISHTEVRLKAARDYVEKYFSKA